MDSMDEVDPMDEMDNFRSILRFPDPFVRVTHVSRAGGYAVYVVELTLPPDPVQSV